MTNKPKDIKISSKFVHDFNKYLKFEGLTHLKLNSIVKLV